ncbi:MAG: hypothetical protein V2B18_22415 [Pseudomonadota bacterium]
MIRWICSCQNRLAFCVAGGVIFFCFGWYIDPIVGIIGGAGLIAGSRSARLMAIPLRFSRGAAEDAEYE